MLVTVFTALAISANIAFVWPQALRLIRSRDVSGVSPATWAISITLFSVWSAYAVATQYWALAIANLSCLAAGITILAVGLRAGWPSRWLLVAASGVAVAALFGMVFPPLLACVMTLAGVALRVPQFLSLLRSQTVTGVSSATWLLSGATAACWMVVSVDRGATAVAVANGGCSRRHGRARGNPVLAQAHECEMTALALP